MSQTQSFFAGHFRIHLPILMILALLLFFSPSCARTDAATDTSVGTTTAATAAETAATTIAATAAATTATTAIAETTAGSASIAPFSAADLLIIGPDQPYMLLEDAAGLLAALGDEYQYSEAESCVYTGMDKTFDYGNILVYTVPFDEIDLLDGFDIMDGSLATSRGIRVGDNREKVLGTYGPQIGSESDLLYNVSGDPENLADPRLTFIMDGDTVVAISYYSGSNAQG